MFYGLKPGYTVTLFNRNFMKRLFTISRCKLALSAVMLLAYTAAKATFVVVPIPTTGPNGYNEDVIANGAPPSGPAPVPNWAQQTTTSAFDAGTYNLVENGYKPTATSPNVLPSLPANGLIPATNVPNLYWQLASSSGPGGVGNSNNTRRMTGSTGPTSTFTINFPTGANALIGDIYILGASTGGATSTTITVNFVGGTTQVFTGQNFLDWIGGNPYEYLGAGRVIRSTGLGDPAMITGDNPRFYAIKLAIPFTQLHKQIQSVTIQKNTPSPVLNILAVTVDNHDCLPIQVQPTLLANSNGLTEATFVFTPPTSLAPGFTTPQNYEWVVTTSATPPATNPVPGAQPYTLTGPAPYQVHATGLPSGTPLYFHIRTDCGSGSYSQWRTVPFSTKACTPVAASMSNVTMVSATANITAGAQTGVVLPGMTNQTYGYEWLVDQTSTAPTGSGTLFPPGAIPTGGWTAFPTATQQQTISGLNAGTTYFLHARKVCVADVSYSAWTNIQFPTLPCPPVPVIPVVPTTGPNAITEVSAYLKWNLPPNYNPITNPSVGYEWYINNSTTPPSSGWPLMLSQIYPTRPAPTAFDTTVTGLIPQTDYYLHVRNICAGGFYSAWATPRLFRTKNCPPAGQPVWTVLTPDTVIVKWPGTTIPGWYEYQYALTLSSQTAAPTTWTPTSNDSIILTQFSQPTPICPGVSYKLWVRSNCTSTNAPWQWVLTCT